MKCNERFKKKKEETKKHNKTGRSQLISWLFRQNYIKTNDFCVLAMHAILQDLSKDIYLKRSPKSRKHKWRRAKEIFKGDQFQIWI